MLWPSCLSFIDWEGVESIAIFEVGRTRVNVLESTLAGDLIPRNAEVPDIDTREEAGQYLSPWTESDNIRLFSEPSEGLREEI